MGRMFTKKFFLFAVGTVCSVKWFTTGSRNSVKDVRKSQVMPDRVRKWSETTVERLLCCGFRRTGKAMGQVYPCWWRICQQINVFSQVRISHVLRFTSICDLFTDSPSYSFKMHPSIHTQPNVCLSAPSCFLKRSVTEKKNAEDKRFPIEHTTSREN
jgi:hypothetical protein